MYKKLTDVQAELQDLREVGIQRGNAVGFDWNLLPYTVKLGTTTYIAGSPASGKSEIQKEILINLSCNYGWKHIIFSPETGSPADIFAELCHAYIGKPYQKHNYQMSEVEKTKAEYFINEHFFIIDNGDNDITIEQFYEEVDKIEKEVGKIHTTTIDPLNELTEVYIQADLGREDKYISRILSLVRKNARKHNRHNFLLTHVRNQQIVTKNNVSYFPFPHSREIAGGQTFFRKGMTIILLWRPPVGLIDEEEDRPFLDNELHFRIGKVKPKGTSIRGTYKMYLDVQKYQYYFIKGDTKIYADRGEHNSGLVIEEIKPLVIEPNKEFDNNFVEATNQWEDNDEAPF